MNVEVLSIPCEHVKKDSYDLVIVIDTLRAGTTIAKALSNGASAVYPAGSVEEAVNLKKKIPFSLLAGERKSFKIDGFDLGNSPLEFNEKVVKGKNMILTTSNGTQAVNKFKAYGPLVSMALSNVKSVAEFSKSCENVLVVCSGSHSEVALEDLYTAGKYISYLDLPALNDNGIVAKSISSEKEIKILKMSHHGRYLSQHGMEMDLYEAIKETKVVPNLKKDPFGIDFFGI